MSVRVAAEICLSHLFMNISSFEITCALLKLAISSNSIKQNCSFLFNRFKLQRHRTRLSMKRSLIAVDQSKRSLEDMESVFLAFVFNLQSWIFIDPSDFGAKQQETRRATRLMGNSPVQATIGHGWCILIVSVIAINWMPWQSSRIWKVIESIRRVMEWIARRSEWRTWGYSSRYANEYWSSTS